MLREVKAAIEACAAQRTAIVILSAGGIAAPIVANVLVSLGCDPAASKQTGSDKISALNAALLESLGATVTDWMAFNDRWLESPKAAEFLNKALELLQTEFDGSYLSVVQDTTTARLLPFWNVVFDRAGIVPRYIFILSEPGEIAKELYTGSHIDPAVGQLIWLRSSLDAEAHSRGKLRAFVDAAQLSLRPAETLKSLADTLQLAFPRDIESAVGSQDPSLQQFSVQLRRSDEKLTGGSRRLATVEWVSVAHEILSDWAVSGERAEARPILDALRDAFDEAVPVFLGISQASSANNAEIMRLQQELCILQEEIRRAQDSAREVEGTAKQAQRELQGRISYLESALAQRAAEVDETWKSLNDAQIEVSSITQELERSKESAGLEIAELRKASGELAKAVDEAQEQVRARYSEIVTLTRMLATETAAARKYQRTAEGLAGISQALERRTSKGAAAWMERLLPWSWHLRRVRRLIEHEGLFDSEAYLLANPDVQEAGVDPLRHYLSHGAIEGRPLRID